MVFFIYSDKYYLDWPGHVFPIDKFRLLYAKLKDEGLLQSKNLLESPQANEAEVLLVHTPKYLDYLKQMTEDPMMGMLNFEVPVSASVIEAFHYATGGTILAARIALKKKTAAMNLGGGFHHAFSNHGEGFCLFNDIAVAIKVMQNEKLIKRAMVIDLDLHQGNGTAHIFHDDPSVFTFSIHQENNYPIKQKSSMDIGLPDFTGDDEYLKVMNDVIPKIIQKHKPELIIYQAGADPYENDMLGALRLTKEGLRKRDELVFNVALKKNIPIAVTLGGGYAPNVQDVVDIHAQTAISLGKIWDNSCR